MAQDQYRTVRLDGTGTEYPNLRVVIGMGHDLRQDRQTNLTPPPVQPDRGDRMIELNGVLWLLDAVLAGGLTPQRMREILVDISALRSDCCLPCDAIMDDWPALDAEQRAVNQQWNQRFAMITAESHPYTLNATETKIHIWDCATVRELPPPVVPDRHTYARRIAFRDSYDDAAGARRVTAAEATAWAAQRRRPSRCKICAPLLPTATTSEATDVPSTR